MSDAPAGAAGAKAGATPLNLALAWALDIGPVIPVRKVPKGGGLFDKISTTRHGYLDASRDPAAIRRMFAASPGATLVGMPTGKVSGLDVLDVDPRHGGDEWERANAHLLPPTRVHKTLSGGSHYYFKHTPGVRSPAGKIAKGIDVRGDDGYIVVAGEGYSTRVNEPVAQWHPELAQLVIARSKPLPPVLDLPSVVTTEAAEAALQDACALIECAAEGDRYEAVKKVQWELAPLVHQGLLDAAEALEAMTAAAEAGGGKDMSKVATAWQGAIGKRCPERARAKAEAEAQEDFKDTAETDASEKAEESGADTSSSEKAGEFTADTSSSEKAEEFGADTSSSEKAGESTAGTTDEPDAKPRPGSRKRKTMLDRMLTPAQCEGGPQREYIIKGLVARGDVSCIYGHPGTGKSIVTPHIAYALAQGRKVFGRRTRQGRVLYIAAEDLNGMCARITALRRRYGDAEDFRVVGCGNLNEQRERDDVKAAVIGFKPLLVVVDTLATAWAGLEENSNSDEGMGAVVAFGQAIAALGPAVILIHHPAKNGDSPRGGGSLEGRMDFSGRLDRNDLGVVQIYARKNRNGPSNEYVIDFRFEVVALGTDEDGDPITTVRCVELEAGEKAKRPKRLAAGSAAALRVLKVLALDRRDRRVTETEWRAACVEGREVSAAEDPDSRTKAFRRAYRDLVRGEVVGASTGNVWVIEGASPSLEEMVNGTPEEDFT